MSTDAFANVVHSDSQLGIVTVGSIPDSARWLGQTTYLFDASEHTTTVLAQTDQPTDGVTLAPVPYNTQAQAPLPSTTASSLPSGWAYEGCYNDVNPRERVLPLKQPYATNLTVPSCVWSCLQLGYSFSGVESSIQCFCGNAILNGATLADWDFDCNSTCGGNKMQICGGHEKMSVYSNRTLTTSQSAPAQGSEFTAVAPTKAPSPTAVTSSTPIPAGKIAGAVIAAVTGIILMVALILYLRRRIRRHRVQSKSRMQMSRNDTQEWPLADRVPSWEDFMKGVESNAYDLGLKSAGSGSHPSLPELRERYEQLRRKKQQSHHTSCESSDAYPASPTRYSPPQNRPASILKHPKRTRTINKAQRTLNGEDEQGHQDIPAARNRVLAKKYVRFGVNQIREFGRSPFIGHSSNASEF